MANWLDESIPVLRTLLMDWEEEPEYSDSRLSQVLLAAARLVLLDMSFSNNYEISMLDETITPDPLSEEDDSFINFIILRANCLCDIGTYKKKAALDGIRAALGPLNLGVAGHAAGFKTLLELGACKTYAEAKRQYLFGGTDFIRGVFSPFVSNTFDPRYLRMWNTGDSGRYFN